MTLGSESYQRYTIEQLTELTGMSRRTIHYYVKERLLPPPEGRGQNARYGEDHHLKLVLIGRLKESTHLRLQGIREIIEPLNLGELRDEIRRLGGRVPRRGEADAAVKAMFFSTDMSDLSEDGAPRGSVRQEEPTGFAPPELRRLAVELTRRVTPGTETGETDAADVAGDTWQHIRISDDLEIHYRGQADNEFMRKLVFQARKLFPR